MVGVQRFELWASWSQTTRATTCATPRNDNEGVWRTHITSVASNKVPMREHRVLTPRNDNEGVWRTHITNVASNKVPMREHQVLTPRQYLLLDIYNNLITELQFIQAIIITAKVLL